MKKCLQSIAKAEGLHKSLANEWYEETHLSSGGDLRNAIFAMQFATSLATQTTKTASSGSSKTTKKDAKMSTFHALGKLLYAKRKLPEPTTSSTFTRQHCYDSDDSEFPPINTSRSSSLSTKSSKTAKATASLSSSTTKKWEDGRGQLEFVPEDVLNNIDMGLSSSITFLSYHSPDFFTDVTDLSQSYDLLSDTATFLDRYGQSDGAYPNEYAACLGGRAVAQCNRHPAPPQFRQFTAPKVFSVMKKNRENEYKIERLRKRLALVGCGGGTDEAHQSSACIHDTIGSAHQFVTDSLPYMRSVIPQGEFCTGSMYCGSWIPHHMFLMNNCNIFLPCLIVLLGSSTHLLVQMSIMHWPTCIHMPKRQMGKEG